LRILAVISGEYGRRNVNNICTHGPQSWEMETWQAPAVLPPVIDYPEDYLPESLPEADLILSFAEQRGVAELLPDMAAMTGAQALIAAVDNESWLPTGLARQLREWLARINVMCATAKPLCSLTEVDFEIARGKRLPHFSPLIAEFARYFGQPNLRLELDPESGLVLSAQVQRDSVCGCARHVAGRLVGLHAAEVVEKAGLLHHHYPCLASMVKLPDYNKDTLMHESGHLLQDNLRPQVKPFIKDLYIKPDGKTE
jgi:thymidylate synthase